MTESLRATCALTRRRASRPRLGALRADVTLAAARLGLLIVDPESSSTCRRSRVPGGGVPVAAFSRGPSRSAVVGALVASRQPGNPIGLDLLRRPRSRLGLLILGSPPLLELRARRLRRTPRSWRHGSRAGSGSPAIFRSFVLFPLLFPTGELRRALAPGRVGRCCGLRRLAAWVRFHPGVRGPPVENPYGLGDATGDRRRVPAASASCSWSSDRGGHRLAGRALPPFARHRAPAAQVGHGRGRVLRVAGPIGEIVGYAGCCSALS